MMSISFNKTYQAKNQLAYVNEAFQHMSSSHNDVFIKKCEAYLETNFNYKKALLTSSCTDALEMCALLLDISYDDEIIVPSYTFVSTANAFALRGAKLVFADSSALHPTISVSEFSKLITSKTKAIVVVHYAGMSDDIDEIRKLADDKGIYLIEDAAQCINSFFKNKALGSFGHLSTLSFHYTKTISCGEGGALIINDERFIKRAEILREKGTNRTQFLSGEVSKYEWVDLGSSFGISEISAAVLYSQLEELEYITQQRKKVWDLYFQLLTPQQITKKIKLPVVNKDSQHNYNCFYIVCENKIEREKLSSTLKSKSIQASFHYLPLHSSPFGKTYNKNNLKEFTNANLFSDCLLRLPLYPDLSVDEVKTICQEIQLFFSSK